MYGRMSEHARWVLSVSLFVRSEWSEWQSDIQPMRNELEKYKNTGDDVFAVRVLTGAAVHADIDKVGRMSI